VLIGVVGISHKTASLSLQEQAVLSASKQIGRVLLSTCNRTEIYFSQDDVPDLNSGYSFFGTDCFSHLARVTAGLDSALLAETAIQSQVKLAYETARAQGLLAAPLHYLFQKSLKLAKDARSSFPLFESKHQLEALIFKLIDTFLANNPSLLFIGCSDVNRKIIHYLSRKKQTRITLVSQNLQAAYLFARNYGLTLKSRDELLNAHLYDAIISATEGTQGYVLSSLKGPSCTQLILDLSVPRTIHPALANTTAAVFLNMQQLGELFAKTHPAHEVEVAKVNNFINSSVLAYAERFERKNLVCI
jgi:glutamyl-tRNA reductase